MAQTDFQIIREISVSYLNDGGILPHAKVFRKKRIEAMQKYLTKGIAVTAFEVIDKKQRHNIHLLFTNGVVKVLDINSHNMVTTFCNSVRDMKQYWKDINKKPYYYRLLLESCETNYPIYKEFCKDADDDI
jgi:hypothetical protein